MANYCDYEARVIGSENACTLVTLSMPCMDYCDFDDEDKIGNLFVTHIVGNCKWSVNYGVSDHLDRVKVDSMTEKEIQKVCANYCDYSLRAKSEAFQCEIMVHYWSGESGFDQFDHFKNGKILKQRKIEYSPDNEFDWDTLEFVGHEGEYDKSVDGEAQNEQFMNTLLGLGGTSSAYGRQDDKEKDILASLKNIAEQLENLAAEEGIDIADGQIGETGFDMYKWTFTEGKTVKGNGWTIAIPDGFVQVKSNEIDPTTGKKRLFVLVPISWKNEKNTDNIPIKILSGVEHDGPGLEDMWMVHPNARAGVACMYGVAFAEMMERTSGQASEILSVGWADVAAHIMVQDTSLGTYSYHCSVITEKKNQLLRVQTGFVRDEQKHNLDLSVQSWLKTMKYDKPNKVCPKKTIFEEEACFNELLKGKMTRFEEAVKQATDEYTISYRGRIRGLEYMSERGILNEYTGETIRSILEEAMEVRLFFLEKADQLIERLLKKHVASSVIEEMMQRLLNLEKDCTEFDYDDEKIEICVPKPVRIIRDKWKSIAPDVFTPENKANRERLKKIEERQKAKKEREKADEKAKKIASDIRTKMERIEDSYETSANHHKTIIEAHRFDGPRDPRLYDYFSKFDDDIQELGSDTEELLLDAHDSYNEVNESATPRVVISIIEALEEAIEYVEGASIHNGSLGLTFEYKWSSNIPELSKELRRAKTALKKQQEELEAEEKKQEEEDRRFAEAHKYGVAEKDLDKHRKYLSAKEKYEKAVLSKDYDEAAKEFGEAKGYLNANKLKEECDKKSKQLRSAEKAKGEYEKALKKYEEADKKLKECEEEHKKAVAIGDKAVSDLKTKKASYEKDRNDIENAKNKVISDLESKFSSLENELSTAQKEFDATNDALSKTFALAFGKKKKLRTTIASMETTISSLEDSVKNLKEEISRARNDKASSLKKLKDERVNLETQVKKNSQKVDAIAKKLSEAKTHLTWAKDELDKKKKFYDGVK